MEGAGVSPVKSKIPRRWRRRFMNCAHPTSLLLLGGCGDDESSLLLISDSLSSNWVWRWEARWLNPRRENWTRVRSASRKALQNGGSA